MNNNYKFPTIFLNILGISDKFPIKIGHYQVLKSPFHIINILSLQVIQHMHRYSIVKSRNIYAYLMSLSLIPLLSGTFLLVA